MPGKLVVLVLVLGWSGVDFGTGVGRFLSRRDRAIVAWQFTARDTGTKKIRPVGNGMNGCSWRHQIKIPHWTTQVIGHHTVPSGTGLRGVSFLAVNCQATIIPSPWDQNSQTFVHIFDSTSNAFFEDEDDDEYEDD
jgi:hypothetical protein